MLVWREQRFAEFAVTESLLVRFMKQGLLRASLALLLITLTTSILPIPLLDPSHLGIPFH